MTSEPAESTQPQVTPKKKGSGALITRIVIYSLLLVVIVLVLYEYRMKRQAETTANAFLNALREKEDNNEQLVAADLKAHFQGDPTILTNKKADNYTDVSKVMDVYAYKGLFRVYEVKVYYSQGEQKPVYEVTGPGRIADADDADFEDSESEKKKNQELDDVRRNPPTSNDANGGDESDPEHSPGM